MGSPIRIGDQLRATQRTRYSDRRYARDFSHVDQGWSAGQLAVGLSFVHDGTPPSRRAGPNAGTTHVQIWDASFRGMSSYNHARFTRPTRPFPRPEPYSTLVVCV